MGLCREKDPGGEETALLWCCSGGHAKSRENRVSVKRKAVAVLQTASGLQGEEPLVDRRMYDKGNRQTGSVTSE